MCSLHIPLVQLFILNKIYTIQVPRSQMMKMNYCMYQARKIFIFLRCIVEGINWCSVQSITYPVCFIMAIFAHFMHFMSSFRSSYSIHLCNTTYCSKWLRLFKFALFSNVQLQHRVPTVWISHSNLRNWRHGCILQLDFSTDMYR